MGQWLFFGAIYFVLGKFGLLLATLNDNASPVWPAAGMALGLLAARGRRFWPSIFFGAFAVNLSAGSPFLVAASIGVGNMLEALVGASLFHRIRARSFGLALPAEGVAIVIVAFSATLVSATIGMASLALGGLVPVETFRDSWITWWIGDSVGIITVTPLLYALWSKQMRLRDLYSWQNLLTVVFVGAIALPIFATSFGHSFVFAVFPLLLVASFFSGRAGVLSSSLLICAISLWATAIGSGPFSSGTLNQNLVFLQIFTIVVGVTAMAVGGFLSLRQFRVPAMTLVLGWLMAALVFYSFRREEEARDQTKLDHLTQKASELIRARMATYEDALRAGLGLYRASKSVERIEWREFIESLELKERYPGITGVGLISRVAAEDEATFSKAQRLDDYPKFEIQSLSETPKAQDRFVITFLEPLKGNESAIGLDIRSEDERRLAAERARDQNAFMMTGEIKLMQDLEKRPAFLVFIPFYQKSARLESVDQRRVAHRGFIFAPLVFSEFFYGALSSLEGEVSVSIRDLQSHVPIFTSGTLPGEKDSLYEHRKEILTLGGRAFEISVARGSGFLSSHDSSSVWAAAAGALIALLIAIVVAAQASVNQEANLRAIKMHDQLKSQQAQLANSARLSSLGEMAGGVAHEINNPLAIISARASQVKTMLAKPEFDKSKAMERLTQVEATVERISKIIKGLKTFSRSSDREPMRVADLYNVIESALEFCRERFRSNGVELRVNVPKDLQISCREVQIGQVIINLLNNSYDAVQELSEKWVELSAKVEGAHVVIAVTDSGRGISSAVADKLMQPFFTTKELGKGTGLGLSISRGIVEDHGGRFYLDRNFEFTRFVVELPLLASGQTQQGGPSWNSSSDPNASQRGA